MLNKLNKRGKTAQNKSKLVKTMHNKGNRWHYMIKGPGFFRIVKTYCKVYQRHCFHIWNVFALMKCDFFFFFCDSVYFQLQMVESQENIDTFPLPQIDNYPFVKFLKSAIIKCYFLAKQFFNIHKFKQ